MGTLNGKTLFITGASRGIGLAIALRAARDGANVVIAAKTVDPNPKLPGTIFTAAREIERAGGKALPLQVDIRFEEHVLPVERPPLRCRPSMPRRRLRAPRGLPPHPHPGDFSS